VSRSPAPQVRWLNDREQAAWRAYIEAATSLIDSLDRQLQLDAGMPHAYYEILVRLSESPGHRLRMSELAAATRSSRSRLSHAVARLEQRGWVQRREYSDDRRGQVAALTDSGMQVLINAAPGHVGQVRAALVDVLTAEQLDQLREISQRILDHLGAR